MRCRQTRKMMSAYIDDELTSANKETFLLHVGKCQTCSQKLSEAQAVHQLFAKAEKIPAPYGFTSRVMANLESEVIPEKSICDAFIFRPLIPRTAGVVLALAVMLFGIIAGNHLVTNRTINQEQVSIEQTFSLDVFQATPSDSIGGVYADMMEVKNEG
jgi:anti-sigma factor RsiW